MASAQVGLSMFYEPIRNADQAHKRRKHARFDVQCRARIRIGKRHYSGYLHNISRGGAKIRTVSPIGRPGDVLLHLPDLPPLKCTLRWTNAFAAGVCFSLPLSDAELAEWTSARSVVVATPPDDD